MYSPTPKKGLTLDPMGVANEINMGILTAEALLIVAQKLKVVRRSPRHNNDTHTMRASLQSDHRERFQAVARMV